MDFVCQDWRDCPPTEIQSLLAAEAAEWRDQLQWDVSDSWNVIEPARAAGALPGFVARSASGRILGWTWFLQHRGCLQVAALVADDPCVVRGLCDAIATSAEAATSSAQVWSVRGIAPGLEAALKDTGLAVARYLYLSAPLTATAHRGIAGREFHARDLEAVAALFERAYGHTSQDPRAFAPGGTFDDWKAYVQSLVVTDGCGTLLRAASFVVDRRTAPTRGLQPALAAVLTTVVNEAAGVAHLAQVAVDPGIHGRGVGRELLEDAMRASFAHGCRVMTLLVGAENASARRLYASAGFQTCAEFVVASSPQPRLSTSVALASDGASTRR